MAWYSGRHQICTAWCWMMIAAVTVESKGLCMDMDPMQYCSVESLTCGSWPARQWTQVSVGGALFILRLCLDLSARSTSGPTRALTTHAESSHTERHEVGQQMPVCFSHKLVGWLGSLGRNHFCLSASEYIFLIKLPNIPNGCHTQCRNRIRENPTVYSNLISQISF